MASGRLLAVAGQIGLDPGAGALPGQGARLVSGGFAAQFSAALRNVATVVTAAGGHGADIIAMTIFVLSLEDYRRARPALKAIWQTELSGHYPAITLVGASALLDPDALVEISALAVLP